MPDPQLYALDLAALYLLIRCSLSWSGRGKMVTPTYEMRHKLMNGDSMPLYEHVMIARQDLSNTQAEGLIEHFSTVLSDNGGKVVEHEYWGVKTMAYKINKNRKGHYAFLRSDAPATAVQEMERLMRLHDDVMRVLTIKVDAHEEGPSVQMQKRDDRERGDRSDRPDRGDRGDRPRR
jgi:small subunit ribosomal protein S6